MPSAQELKTVRKKIAQCENWLAERLHARLCGYKSEEERWQHQEWLNEKHLDGWHRAFRLLSGEDYAE